MLKEFYRFLRNWKVLWTFQFLTLNILKLATSNFFRELQICVRIAKKKFQDRGKKKMPLWKILGGGLQFPGFYLQKSMNFFGNSFDFLRRKKNSKKWLKNFFVVKWRYFSGLGPPPTKFFETSFFFSWIFFRREPYHLDKNSPSGG